MKKTIAILSSIMLLGAGCFTPQAGVQTETETEPTDVSTNTQIEGDFIGDPEGAKKVGDEITELINNLDEQEAEVTAELTMNMDSGNFYFTPDRIEAKAGQTVNLNIVSNEGFHTVVIDAIDFKKTVKAGEMITFVAPTEPGEYEFYCDVGSHKAMGMYGTLVITE